MSSIRSPRKVVLAAPFFAVGLAVALTTAPSDSPASASDKRVAHSICDAQELKALKAEDPHLEIEIPAEFDTPWPTLSACRSYEGALDPEAPGPEQPIPFSHKHHAGEYQIECLYCHSGTDRSQAAGVPSVETCMGCHSLFPPSYDQAFEGIRDLKQYWEDQEPIPWEQIHRLPEHVQFRHNRHIQAGFECQKCHGAVEEMDKVYMTPDTKWWPWGLPTAKLEMGWCVQCHRENGASQDCLTCHY